MEKADIYIYQFWTLPENEVRLNFSNNLNNNEYSQSRYSGQQN